MSIIDDLFTRLRREKRKALMPFVTAGDPDLAFTADVLRELVGRGCHLCEVGIPYSDPIADGPVIQASYTRALAHKIKLADILQTLGGYSAEAAAHRWSRWSATRSSTDTGWRNTSMRFTSAASQA